MSYTSGGQKSEMDLTGLRARWGLERESISFPFPDSRGHPISSWPYFSIFKASNTAPHEHSSIVSSPSEHSYLVFKESMWWQPRRQHGISHTSEEETHRCQIRGATRLIPMWNFTPNIAEKFQERFKEVTTNIIKVCQCEETKQLPCFSAIAILTRNSNTRGTKIPLKRAQCGLHNDHELCQWPLNPFISQLTPSKRWLALGEKESVIISGPFGYFRITSSQNI